MQEVRNFVGGRWEERDGREAEPVYDPATAEDVDRAVKKAQEAFPGWSATPVVERARLLFRFKALLEEHYEELRDLVTLENGKDRVRFFTENKVEIVRYFSDPDGGAAVRLPEEAGA